MIYNKLLYIFICVQMYRNKLHMAASFPTMLLLLCPTFRLPFALISAINALSLEHELM